MYQISPSNLSFGNKGRKEEGNSIFLPNREYIQNASKTIIEKDTKEEIDTVDRSSNMPSRRHTSHTTTCKKKRKKKEEKERK